MNAPEHFYCMKLFLPAFLGPVTKFDKSTLLDAAPLLSYWPILTKIGTSALLDAVQIMKPPEGKSAFEL